MLSGYTVDPVLIVVYVMLVLIILVARAVLNTEVQRAEEARQRAKAAQTRITGGRTGSRQRCAAGATGRATPPTRPGRHA
jgi:hypothetical protein